MATCSTIRRRQRVCSAASTWRRSPWSAGAHIRRRSPTTTHADAAHLGEYARLAATAEGFADYLDHYVHAQRAA